MNADHLLQTAKSLDTKANEATKHPPRKLMHGEKQTPYFLAKCMRDIATAIGDEELTQEAFDSIFPELPTVFNPQVGPNYGPQVRLTSYRAAVEYAAKHLGVENPLTNST